MVGAGWLLLSDVQSHACMAAAWPQGPPQPLLQLAWPSFLLATLHLPLSHPQGCFVLYPPEAAGEPRCLIEFIGGSFVGAAPQLAYRPLLEALAARGALVSTALLASIDECGTVPLRHAL